MDVWTTIQIFDYIYIDIYTHSNCRFDYPTYLSSLSTNKSQLQTHILNFNFNRNIYINK